MTSSLVPERPLLISPTLAATIGLEEAVMLHILSELLLKHPTIINHQRKWVELNQANLSSAMPFWTQQDIQRVQESMLAKGLILVEPCQNKIDCSMYTINQALHSFTEPAQSDFQVSESSRPQPSEASPSQSTTGTIFNPSSSGRANLIPPDWQPNEDLFQQCFQHNIPADFIEQRVKSFIMYWRERQKSQYSWQNTFLKYIIKEWHTEKSYQGAKELETNMSANWQPSEEALIILERAGISHSFLEDSIPEFVLYWRERGLVTGTWSTKFIAHIRRQWAKFTSEIDIDNSPRLVPDDFQPSDSCYDVLDMARIDIDFAREQIPEFILYWQERKEVGTSWNTRFLQHVKYKWANQHQSSLPANQQIENTIKRFTDRSWAD